MKKILVTGSLAYDYIMHFNDIFANHILPEKLNILNVSFTADQMSKNFGGTAGNISYSLSLLKESPILFSTVGKDFKEYKEYLEKKGVCTDYIKEIKDEWTASAHIITDKNDNQITAFYGGAMLKNDFSIKEILNKENIDIAVIAANGKKGMLRYCKELKEAKIKYIYDPGQSLPSFKEQELKELAEGAYIIVMNEYEKELFLKKSKLKEEELLNKIEYLIITQGEKGTDIYKKDKNKKIHIPPTKTDKVLDPTGAGDAFRGGLLKGLIHNLPIELSVELASVCGCYAVESIGTQSYSYTIEEFKKRFKENYGEKQEIDKIF